MSSFNVFVQQSTGHLIGPNIQIFYQIEGQIFDSALKFWLNHEMQFCSGLNGPFSYAVMVHLFHIRLVHIPDFSYIDLLS